MKKILNSISQESLLAEYEAVFFYVKSICDNEEDVKEITQETFLKAWQHKDRFRGEAGVYTWLCAIARNTRNDRYRKSEREIPAENVENDIHHQMGLEQALDDKLLLKQVHILLHQMPEPYKEVFSLRIFGELSHAEIAELFQKSEGCARITYYRAKLLLLEQLQREGYL